MSASSAATPPPAIITFTEALIIGSMIAHRGPSAVVAEVHPLPVLVDGLPAHYEGSPRAVGLERNLSMMATVDSFRSRSRKLILCLSHRPKRPLFLLARSGTVAVWN